MAEYYPPIQDIPIFDTNDFIDVTECLTIEKANKKYLEFPYAQGDETLKGITVQDKANFNGGFDVNGAFSDVNFNNYNTNIYGDFNCHSSLQFVNPLGNVTLQMFAGTALEGAVGYILNYGEVGMFGNYIFGNNGTPGKIGFRLASTPPTLSGTDELTIYADDITNNGTIITKSGTLDILSPFTPLGGIPPNIIRMVSNKPSGTLSGHVLGSLQFAGYNGVSSTAFSNAGIECFIGSNWTVTDRPTILRFLTTPSASTVSRSAMALTGNGFLRIGTSTNASSAPLHVSTVAGGSNPMILVDRGSSTANLASILISNDYNTYTITQRCLQLATVSVAGTLTVNSLLNDSVVRCINQIGTTTNWLRLSACYEINKNAPSIDNNNIMRLGDEAINARATTTSAPLVIGSVSTGSVPCILVRGGISGVTYGGRIDFKCPNSGANTIIMRTTNTDDMDITTLINGATCFFTGLNIGSLVTATYDCGTATAYWKNVRGLNAYIAMSDERKKIDIKPSTLGLDFINDLKPVSYKWGDYTDREHYGLIAQDVKASLDKRGKGDVGIWCLADKEDSESFQALRYTELISPMIQAIKELTLLVKELRSEINELKGNQFL